MEKKRLKCVALILGFEQNFWQDQRVQRTARTLASAGYEVLAYTPAESKVHERPIDDITVKYVKTPLGRSKLLYKLFLLYILYDIVAALDILKRKVHICHCNDFDTVPCGAVLKLVTLGRVKVVYDSHEDYPLFMEWGHGKLLGKVIGIAESILIRFFVDRAIGAIETLRLKFEKRGVEFEAIFNCQELLDPTPTGKDEAKSLNNDMFQVAYQGKIMPERGYKYLVEAADILINRRKITGINFILIGDISSPNPYIESLFELVKSKGLQDSIHFTGFMIHQDMMRILSRVDMGLALFQPIPKYGVVMPNKLFENLVAGIPTVAGNCRGMADIIKDEKCGLVVDATQPEEIADAIEYLYKNKAARLEMGRNALRAAQEKYNFSKQAEKLLAFYGDIQ